MRLGVPVAMRDGTLLATDVELPDGTGPVPAILVRTPYDKVFERDRRRAFFDRLLAHGYAVVVQDVRGRFNSDGTFFPYVNEAQDGFDTVAWIAAQPWCDGAVGMWGASYAGQVQWQAASLTPPALKAIVPVASPPASLFANEPICNGAFLVPFGDWMAAMGRRSFQRADVGDTLAADRPFFDALPLSDLAAAAGVQSTWWDEMLRHPTLDDFWRRGAYDRWSDIAVPALGITGWWDLNFPGAPTSYAAMRAEGATPQARAGQRLLIGPWAHAVNTTATLNGIDFGPDALIDLDGLTLRFLDRWLKGADDGWDDEPPVRAFVPGAGAWRTFAGWPPPGARELALYLDSGGRANGRDGDGRLAHEPASAGGSDTYRYDPRDPVRQVWRITDGPVDDGPVTDRADVLCFTTPPLARPLTIAGPVRLVLHAASSARDTDWHVRLVDVHPDGSARYLCHGVLRARFRHSHSEPRLLEPGRAERYEIALDATANRFAPGHRVRLELTSSWMTRYDRNTNTGNPNPFADRETAVALQTVFHGAGRPSRLLLPELPQGTAGDQLHSGGISAYT